MQNNLIKHESTNLGTRNFWNDFFGFNELLDSNHYEFMKTDIVEYKDHYSLEIDVPSFKKEELSINLEDGYLTISAKKTAKSDDKEINYIRKERGYEEYSRSFYVGEDVDVKNINAKLNDGVLTVTINKIEPKKPVEHSIAIQ